LSLKTKVVEGFPVRTSKPCRLRFIGYATKPTERGRYRTRVKI
jgi:hypothetical protein